MGTQQNTDVDVDWLPKETTTEFSKLYPMFSCVILSLFGV